MLLRFSLENFLSFKEKAEINFRLTEKQAQDYGFAHKTKAGEVSTAVAIYGPNGSGKTNVLKGLMFLDWFAHVSFQKQPPQEKLPFSSWFSSQEPTSFELEYLAMDGSVFLYKLQITPDQVINEALSRKEEQDWTPLFMRTWNPTEKAYDFTKLNPPFNQLPKMVPKDLTRNNASFLSMAHQFGVKLENILPPDSLGNINQHGRIPSLFMIPRAITVLAPQEKNLPLLFSMKNGMEWPSLQEIETFLQNADLGLNGLEFIEPPAVQGNVGKRWQLLGKHELENSEIHKLDFSEESGGTQALLGLSVPLLCALKNGNPIVIDELEDELHPDIVALLVDMFDDPDKNPKGAQLIFSTHDTTLMNRLRPPHIYLAEKTNSQSALGCLADMKGLEEYEDLESNYRAGNYGAVPDLDDIRFS